MAPDGFAERRGKAKRQEKGRLSAGLLSSANQTLFEGLERRVGVVHHAARPLVGVRDEDEDGPDQGILRSRGRGDRRLCHARAVFVEEAVAHLVVETPELGGDVLGRGVRSVDAEGLDAE